MQTGSNSYDVRMTLFRFCSGINYSNSYSIRLANQSGCTFAQNVSVNLDSIFNIPFGDECYTPPGLCVQQYEYSGTITSLPNNPAGYIGTISISARNSGLINIGSSSMGLYTKIPDPALAGGNSTPRFVDYPRDGYFCVNNEKCIDFSATDPDGDSLVYNLVNPIASFTASCGYNYSPWNPTFNLANYLGSGSRCIIDSKTGCVMALPRRLGKYVISVRVDEYRNGVKIGETVRDLQYEALNCSFNTLPEFYETEEVKTLKFDQNGCFDLAAFDNNTGDTFYIDVISDAFNYGAIATLPNKNANSKYDFSWKNATTGTTQTITDVEVKKLTATKFEGVGKVGIRFCWTPDQCEILATDTFNLTMHGYSLGCDGSVDSVEKVTKIVIDKPQSSYLVPNVFSPNEDGINDIYRLEQGAFDRCLDNLTVKIYNRWGQQVFESDDAQFKWNGRDESGDELSEGTYFVILQGFYGGKEVTENFPVTLFR